MHLFGHFLVQKGLVTPADVLEALNIQRVTRETIGSISVKKGLLNTRQVLEVLNKQALGDRRQFGEIAVSMGLLKHADVAILLAEQAQSVKALGEALVEMGAITHESMERELREFLADAPGLFGA